MRIILQKVSTASVKVEEEAVGSIGRGYVLLFCVLRGDTAAQAQLLAEKIVKLRLFTGRNDMINDQSILDIAGDVLVISQFTLAGRTEKGNRPDYTAAAPAEEAEMLYRYFIGKLKELGVRRVEEGRFGAMMRIESVQEGPVTLMLDR